LGVTELRRKDMPAPQGSGNQAGMVACRLPNCYLVYNTPI
jgi:hypothetical protein